MSVLSFDLALLFAAGQGSAQAVIQRDMSAPDTWGGNTDPDWQTFSTLPCVLWWDKSSGVRSANREYVTPARTVPISQGGMIVPFDSDVTEDDRVLHILDHAGSVWIDGLFTITGVLDQGTHVEAYLTRSHLGG